MIKILLDIDGTILPAYLNDKSRPKLTLSLDLYSLAFYADIVHEFSELSKQPNCEVIMCSSWAETSLDIARELDIQCQHYLQFVQINPKNWYKWDTITDFCQQHPKDKIILCDDLANRANTPKRPRNLIKVFQPKPATGLTLRDLVKIKKIVLKDSKNKFFS